MSWGSYVQNGFNEELDQLGSQLSIKLDCAVHYPAYNKHLFECKCGVIFPIYYLKGNSWEDIMQKHEDEKSMVRS